MESIFNYIFFSLFAIFRFFFLSSKRIFCTNKVQNVFLLRCRMDLLLSNEPWYDSLRQILTEISKFSSRRVQLYCFILVSTHILLHFKYKKKSEIWRFFLAEPLTVPSTVNSKINGTPKHVYLPIFKVHSILTVANLLIAHNTLW